jgi:hypothetical protein
LADHPAIFEDIRVVLALHYEIVETMADGSSTEYAIWQCSMLN